MADRMTKETFEAMKEATIRSMRVVADRLDKRDPAVDHAWSEIENMMALSLRVLAKTNLSKIRSEQRSVEIGQHLTGRPVIG